MLIFFYLIGALLLAGIFLVLYRVFTLVSIYRSSERHKPDKSNQVNAYLMLLFLFVFLGLFWWLAFDVQDKLLPRAASLHGVGTDQLFWIGTVIILIPFTLLHILLFFAVFKYRHKATRKARYHPVNNKLEITWTLVTATVLAILIFMGSDNWYEIMSPPPENSEVVGIMGSQFSWRFRYPGKDGKLGATDFRLIDAVNQFGLDLTDPATFDDFMPREIHIPKGKPVLFDIRARDVIHSVFAPHFRLKMDAVPGMSTHFWFVPLYTTEEMREITDNPDFDYEIACAEVCGRGHFAMRATIVVDEPEAYEKWYASQKSWISQHPDYLAAVPDSIKKMALNVTKPINTDIQ